MKKFFVFIFLIIVGILIYSIFIENQNKPEINPPTFSPESFNRLENPWEYLEITSENYPDSGNEYVQKIVGGSEVSSENKYPFVASFHFGEWGHYCGGALIAPSWVLTAAHCWTYFTYESGAVEGDLPIGWDTYIPSDYDTVILGEHDLNDISGNEQVFVVSAVYVHPSYDKLNSFGWDIALIKLNSDAILNESVNTINLIDDGVLLENEMSTITIGWGDLNWDPDNELPSPNTLQEVDLKYLSDSSCTAYKSLFETDSMLCAGLLAGGKGACKGDSGGPLFYKEGLDYLQIGIVSWGAGCAQPGYPGVYASMDTLHSWVTSTINNYEAITLEEPTLISPSIDEILIDESPTLIWLRGFDKPLRYNIIVNIESSLNDVDLIQNPTEVINQWVYSFEVCNSSDCSWEVTDALPKGYIYSWKIISNRVGYTSGNGSTQKFSIMFEPSPTPTSTPTILPTSTPTPTPTSTPTNLLTSTPSDLPTSTPTPSLTNTATNLPTSTPIKLPSNTPIISQTNLPTNTQISEPTPTVSLTTEPYPTVEPSQPSQKESNEDWSDYVEWFYYYIIKPIQRVLCQIMMAFSYELPAGCK